ncbi:MAG: phosphoribosylaminoimidazolesuccinocarboxamide synthase [Chitinophagaceae bacterium]
MVPFSFPGQTGFYSGKVRDVYSFNEYIVMVASDRISAFDVILPRLIPFKGQVLNQIAAYMLKATSDICPNWLMNVPAPSVSIGKKCIPFKIEMVVRGNLTGHAWRTYSSGQRILCGAVMPEGMKENDYFPTPIITPSTKAEHGHDEDISPADIIAKGLATEAEWKVLSDYTLQIFERGKKIAANHDLILVDTKYEFGRIGENIYLMDEIHTPDSSRYFYAEGFKERQDKGERQKQLSKEFVREWLIANNFMGKEGQMVPQMTDEWVNTISQRYIELYEKVIGEKFIPQPISEDETYKRIVTALHSFGK